MEDQALIGALLKAERIRQNRSQKEVCCGICVPSYLSKIEYGTVKPDSQILGKLYDRLGIRFAGDRQTKERLAGEIKEYYCRKQYGLDTDKIYTEMLKDEQLLSFSEHAVDWLIIKGAQGEDTGSCLMQLKMNMTPVQKAYYSELGLEEYIDADARVAAYEKAADILKNSFAMVGLCKAYLLDGNYTAVHEMGNRVMAAAINEGNTYQLAEFFFLSGTAYACLDMEEMMMVNYDRGIHLLQNTGWKSELSDIYYNIGATYISFRKYGQALDYLFMAYDAQDQKSFWTAHKIALAYIRSGDIRNGKKFLSRLENDCIKNKGEGTLEYLMYKEAAWECRENFEEAPEYLILLEKLVRKIKSECHFGFLYFYRDVVTETYARQRRYKKALEFQQLISSNIAKNTI